MPKANINSMGYKESVNWLELQKNGTTEIIVIITEENKETRAGKAPFFPPIIILNPAFLYSLSNTQEIAIKCGICQKNWMAKSKPDSNPKSFVAATQPSKIGIAPGKAPIKIATGEHLFNGV